MNRALFSSQSDEWATPQWIFDELDAEFRFTYLISDGVDLYEETYTPEWGLLEGYISYLMDYLKEADLWDLYCEKWRARDQ